MLLTDDLLRAEGLVPVHTRAFFSLSSDTYDWSGHSARDWMQWVAARLPAQVRRDSRFHPDSYAISPQSKAELFEMVADSSIDTMRCCIAILAWGGMHRANGVSALMHATEWIGHAEQVRSGLGRVAAYDGFRSIRARNSLPGMGPAYFTKLIHFLMPPVEPQGYILDQWTSRSINLLRGETLIALRRGLKGKRNVAYSVSDQNTAVAYEGFCALVERLALMMASPPAEVEVRLFSSGRGVGAWRNYVVNADGTR